MNLVTLVYGAGGALWNDKLCRAFENLREKLASESIELEIWGVEHADRIDRSPDLVKEWFAFNDDESMKNLDFRLADGDVGLVVIASPNEKHRENLEQSAKTGRVPYIIVEKPLAESTKSAEQALALQQSTASICKGIDHYVAKAGIQELLEWAGSGELTKQIGGLYAVEFYMMERKPIDEGRAPTLDAGLTFDMTIHGFAILGRLLRALDSEGRVLDPNRVQIEAAWAGQYVESPIHGETASRIECSISGGPRATLSIGKGIMDDKRLVLVGTKNTLSVDIAQGTISIGTPGTESKILFENTADAYETLLEEAIRAALSPSEGTQTAKCLIDFREAANALQLVEAARKQFVDMVPYQLGTIPRAFADLHMLNGVTFEMYHNREGVERAILREMFSAADQAIDESGRFVLVVPGGSSFLGVGRLLAYGAIDRDLSKWEIYFSDEHAGLPHGADENNCRMLLEGGGFGELLHSGRLRPEQLHRIVTEDLGEALEEGKFAVRLAEYEAAYEKCLRAGDKEKSGADLMIIGLGADCHTASLIPSKHGFASPLLTSTRHFDTVTYPEGYDLPSSLRGSITLRGIEAAKRVVLLAFGGKKSEAIRDVLCEPIDPAARPASVIQQVHGTLITDAAGGRLLP